jgi:hypothetical protein
MRMCALPVLLTAALILVGSAAPCQAPVEEREAFGVLQYRTAWVFLGLVSVETGRLDVDFDGEPYYFEVLGRDPSEPGDAIPKTGDHLRAISTWRVVILDYWKSGEKLRLVSPTTRRLRHQDDHTNLTVREGTVVEVRDVQLSKPLGSSRMLWVRVSPSPE